MPYQIAFTVRAPLVADGVGDLENALARLGQEDERRRCLPFEDLDVHFARMFVLDQVTDLDGATIPPTLVFLSDIDAPLAGYLDRLCQIAGSGLDQAFSFCQGYPAEPTPDQRRAYLLAHSIDSSAVYVNTVGRSLAQVRQEDSLRTAIGDFLDAQAHHLAGKSAHHIRSAVGAHVRADASLSWALQPAARPPLGWRLKQQAIVATAVLIGLGLLPFVLLLLPFYLILLRVHERRDHTVDQVVSESKLEALEQREDRICQNQFTVVGFSKPGPFRRFTLLAILGVLDLLSRHVFDRGTLAGVRTIHFARWVMIDDRRRVLFASNYDGSLESYMDDFIDKVAYGLNAVFSNGVGYPKTNWLIFNGAKDEQAFKDLLRAYQIVTPVWYSAYPHLSALNLANNAAIRKGLTRSLSATEAARWAALL